MQRAGGDRRIFRQKRYIFLLFSQQSLRLRGKARQFYFRACVLILTVYVCVAVNDNSEEKVKDTLQHLRMSLRLGKSRIDMLNIDRSFIDSD